MNLHVLAIALLLAFGSIACAHGRVIQQQQMSNEIGADDGDQQQQQQQSEEKQQHVERNFLKFIKRPPATLKQMIGESVEITCEVMGSQLPTIQWIVGHLPVAEIDSIESNVISESSPTAVTSVRSVHVIDHMLGEPRTYTCVGRADSRTVYASTTVYPQMDLKDLVIVRDKPFPGPQKPRIVYSEKMHLEEVDSNIVLPCKVHARPRANVFWMNEKGKVIEQSDRFKVLPTGDLLIMEIRWDDMGSYKCIARNSAGKDTIDTFVYPLSKED